MRLFLFLFASWLFLPLAPVFASSPRPQTPAKLAFTDLSLHLLPSKETMIATADLLILPKSPPSFPSKLTLFLSQVAHVERVSLASIGERAALRTPAIRATGRSPLQTPDSTRIPASTQTPEGSWKAGPPLSLAFVGALLSAMEGRKDLRGFRPSKEAVRWRDLPLARHLDSVTLTLPAGLPWAIVRLSYKVTIQQGRNRLYQKLLCQIQKGDSYFLYGWLPSLVPFADPITGDFFPRPASPFRLQIDVPSDETVIAPASLVRTIMLPERKEKRFVFQSTGDKMAAVFFVSGVFRKVVVPGHKGESVVFYLRPDEDSTLSRLQPLASFMTQGAAFYRELWGDPGFRGPWKVLSFGGSGARGYPYTLILSHSPNLLQAALRDESHDELFSWQQLFLHEIAHTWWGNALTGQGEGATWLHEGLANYASLRALGHLVGAKAERKALRLHIQEFLANAGEGALLKGGGLAQILEQTAYTKGVAVLYELQRQIGQKALDQGLRLFFQAHKGKYASWQKLQTALESASQRSLKRFFSDLIQGTSLPWIRLLGQTIACSKPQRCQISLRLENRGKVESFFPFRLLTSSGPIDLIRPIPPGFNKVVFSFPTKITGVQLDPQGIALHGLRWKALLEAASQAREAEEWDKAKRLYEEILAAFPTHGLALYGLARLHEETSKEALAVPLYRELSSVKPSKTTPSWISLWSSFRYGRFLHKKGKTAQATALLRALLSQKSDPFQLKAQVQKTLASWGYP